MDLANIAALVSLCTSLSTNTASFIARLYNLISKIQDARLDSTPLHIYCQLLRVATEWLAIWFELDKGQLKPGERSIVGSALGLCNVLLAKLDSVAGKAGRDGNERRPKVWETVRFIFSHQHLAKYESALGAQVTAVNLLVDII